MTSFNAGVGSTTLPIFIYGSIKFGVTPQINAISTIIVAVVAVALFIAWRLGSFEGEGRDRHRGRDGDRRDAGLGLPPVRTGRPRTIRGWPARPRPSSRSASSCSRRSPPAGWRDGSHLPAIVGYLAVGLGFSPFTPGYVADHEQLELLADVGVVLLLFEVGIEVDLARLRRDHGRILWAAPVQALLSMAIAAAVFLVTGLEPVAALLVGLCVALSSSRRDRQHHGQPAADDRSPDRGGAARLERGPGPRRRGARGDPAGGHGRRPPVAARGRASRSSASRSWRWPSPGSCPGSCAGCVTSTTCSSSPRSDPGSCSPGLARPSSACRWRSPRSSAGSR